MSKVNANRINPSNAVLELVDVLKDGIVLYRIAAGFATDSTLADVLRNMADVRELCLFRLQPYVQEWNALSQVTVNLKTQLYSRYISRLQELKTDSELLILKQLEGETLSSMEAAYNASHNPMVRETLEELIPLVEENFNTLFFDGDSLAA